MKRYIIKSRQELTDWFSKISIMKGSIYPITLQVYKGEKKDRGLGANALVHIWYRDIAKQAEDRTPEEVERECKLTCGVPILRAESEEFRAMYDQVVKSHDYPTKLVMMDYLPVTSTMDVAQMAEYMDTMHYKYTDAGYYLAKDKEDRERWEQRNG